MARIRFVKPEFFLHEKLSELSPLHRLLFIGLWTLADKDGRLEDRPKRIKVEVLPYDDCDMESMLNDLDSGDFVHRYEVNGERYIAIPGWSKHQKPHPKEQSRNIPEPPCREKTRQAVKFNGKDVSSREKIIASKVDSGVLSLESGVLSLDSGQRPLSADAATTSETQLPLQETQDAPKRVRKPSVAQAFAQRLLETRSKTFPVECAPVDPVVLNKLLGDLLKRFGELGVEMAWDRFLADAHWRDEGCPLNAFLSPKVHLRFLQSGPVAKPIGPIDLSAIKPATNLYPDAPPRSE